MRVIVATANPSKFEEIRRVLEPAGVDAVKPETPLEVEEKGTTFLENAYLKATAYYSEFRMPALADDSGLEVKALGGYPGVFSSRFHSIEFGGREEVRGSPDEANLRKLLRLMEGKRDRSARFVAFVVLYTGEGGFFAEGECRGVITEAPRGKGGFGYDPVFQPLSYRKTMAELPPDEKDRLSHRGRALRKLLTILKDCGQL